MSRSHDLRALTPALLLPVLLWSCVSTGRRDSEPIEWNRYYSTDETHDIMRSYARRFPELTKIHNIGKSLRGQDLLVMEVTAHGSQPAEEKPALYVDGNIHSTELTGSAVTLYLMGHLLEGYGEDDRVTQLLDTRVFYLRPKFNPDGADLALLEDQSLRSTTRPVDSDGDGLADEDPGEDLNRDGFITQMRIPDPDGNRALSEVDPRLMVQRTNTSRGPFYRVMGEGIDNDGDGRLNEDGIGGLDMNRNFPRNWALEYKQSGAGPYPLSEPETRATVEFIDAHRNITGIVHNHTSGGFVYRLPSASDPASFDPADISLIELLGAEYTRTASRPVQPSSTHATNHRYGTLISWGYWDHGVIGWVPEYWPGLASEFEGPADQRELERLRIDDEELGGKYFVEWERHDHPEFGPVEIGGWRSKFISSNPPAEMLEAECALQIPWILYLAEQSPLLKVDEYQVTSLGGDRFRVDIAVSNDGFLPTNLTKRGIEAQVIPPVIAEVELAGATLVEGERRVTLGHLAGAHDGGPGRPRAARSSWVVQRNRSGATAVVVVRSAKGGTLRLQLDI